MAGAVILVVVLLIVGPSLLFVGGMLWSAVLGQALSTLERTEAPPGPADG